MLLRVVTAAVLVSLALAMAVTADAEADLVLPPATDCPPETLETPFTRWSDRARYVLAPDGGFENGGEGWQRSRASIVRASRPLSVRDPADAHALALEPGGSALSPRFCIGFGHPTIRFFARNTGSPLGVLAVSVVATTSLGVTAELPIGVVANLSRRWAPSLPMPVIVNLLAVTGGEARIALRFTAVGPWSSWEIDDVYVDPYSKR